MEMSCRNHPNECTRAYKLNQIGIDKKFFHAAVLAGIQKVDEGHRKHRLDVIPSFLTFLFSRSPMVEALAS